MVPVVSTAAPPSMLIVTLARLVSLAVPVTENEPVLKIAPFAGDVMLTVGAVVSTVNVLTADAGDVLPAASVAVAVIVCEP